MTNILYLIAFILVVAWAIGYFGYQLTGLINILLVLALIAIVIRLFQGKSIF